MQSSYRQKTNLTKYTFTEMPHSGYDLQDRNFIKKSYISYRFIKDIFGIG